MAKKRLNPAIKRSRTRSGCLTCRDRHMKCDEQQPVCKNCIKSKRKCYRGIRLNFTQYMIYNPETVIPVPQEFKFLDQSITIASLYDDGKRSYEPYLHLHQLSDLRESEIQYQQDIYSSFPTAPVAKDYNMLNFDNNTILENFDITNFLLNKNFLDEKNVKQASSYVESSFSPTSQEFTYNIDIQMFINLIENEKYYWVLDLFNEISIWKSVIPHHCLRESENGDDFLIDCLLSCSLKSNSNLQKLTNDQLDLWKNMKGLEITSESIVSFERLLISVVLILLSFKIKISKSLIQLTKFHKNIINNQIKIFNKVITKFNDDVLEKYKSIILISTIQSIIILKFLIIKQIELKSLLGSDDYSDGTPVEKKNDLNRVASLSDESEEIVYNDPFDSNMSMLFGENTFETKNLNDDFAKLDFIQLNYNFQTDINVKSDSLKLREYIWQIIKLSYLRRNQNQYQLQINKNFADISTATQDHTTSSNENLSGGQLFISSQKGYALSILREFIKKIQRFDDLNIVATSNSKIKQIFKIINDSMMENDLKLLWENNFGWTLMD